jgi:hypothetical protein
MALNGPHPYPPPTAWVPGPVRRERGMRRREGALRPDRVRCLTVEQHRLAPGGRGDVKVLKVLKVLNFCAAKRGNIFNRRRTFTPTPPRQATPRGHPAPEPPLCAGRGGMGRDTRHAGVLQLHPE